MKERKMAANHLFSYFLIIFALVFVANGANMKCMEKLSPCQSHMEGSSSSSPSSECCNLLKEMVSDDKNCLCSIFDDPSLLKMMKVTKDDTLKVAESCGAEVDLSVCKDGASASLPAKAPSSDLPTDSSDVVDAPPAPSASSGMSSKGGYGLVATSVALMAAAV